MQTDARVATPPRVLIAGMGNVLRRDDGFGIALLESARVLLGSRPGVSLVEAGIAGIGLVQHLLDGYDALIILDALDRDAAPGAVLVLEPDLERLRAPGASREPIDPHQADVEGVLRMAGALGVLPRHVWIVGCQVMQCDALEAGLTDAVSNAVGPAAARVEELVDRLEVR